MCIFVKDIFSLDTLVAILVIFVINCALGSVSIINFSSFPKLLLTPTIFVIISVAMILMDYILLIQMFHHRQSVFSISFYISSIIGVFCWFLPYSLFTQFAPDVIAKSVQFSFNDVFTITAEMLLLPCMGLVVQCITWLEDSPFPGWLRFIFWNESEDPKFKGYSETPLFVTRSATLNLLSNNTLVFLVQLHFQRNHIDAKTYKLDQEFFHRLTPQQFHFIQYKMEKFRVWQHFGSASGFISVILFMSKNFEKVAVFLPILNNVALKILLVLLILVTIVILYFTRSINYVFHQLKQVQKERHDID